MNSKLPSFKDFISKQRQLNELPQYTDHDYLPFKPMKVKALLALEKTWTEIPLVIPKIKQSIEPDTKIFINKRKTIVIMGLTVYDKNSNSWVLEVLTWMKLDSNTSSVTHKKVSGVFTNEDIRAEKYTLVLYYSLFKSGIYLESDNQQFGGAKYLWKALSRLIDIEIYDGVSSKIVYELYDERKIPDKEIWSKDKTLFLRVLRTKSN